MPSSSLIFLLSFFFYCYGHHRDLHSFPTRRSSDLVYSCPAGQHDDLGISCAMLAWARISVSSLISMAHEMPRSDRKSTRLNSSHTVISYAVFCLKKKKKENDDKTSIQKVDTGVGES